MNAEANVHEGRSATTVGTSRTGAEVLIVGNLATASLVNPEREAMQWADQQVRRIASIGVGETVVVIGIASAFHIRALREKISTRDRGFVGRIVAIDTCADSVAFANARHSGFDFVHVDLAVGVDAFLARPEISSWIMQPYTLLKHKPTMSRVGVSLRTLESWILGRTPETFLAHLRLRPEIAAGLHPARSQRIADVSLLSIRDLSKMWDISAELKTDRRIFRVLEELVR